MFQTRLPAPSFRRGVACLLLLLVTYSITAELAHSHARLLSLNTTSAAVSNGIPAADSLLRLASSGVCLLCQFQQQLAHGLLHTPSFAYRPPQLTARVAADLQRYLLLRAATPRGRAPPTVSPA